MTNITMDISDVFSQILKSTVPKSQCFGMYVAKNDKSVQKPIDIFLLMLVLDVLYFMFVFSFLCDLVD